jgi:hypothetical protein
MRTTSSNTATTTITSTQQRRVPIDPEDIVTVQNKYLFRNGQRFFIKGMAFPIQIPPPTKRKGDDIRGWIRVLEQLASETEINTIRVYDMDCQHQKKNNYDKFLQRAAELGIYVLVPLTASSGSGVLDRDLAAPNCYSRALYQYGTSCLDRFSKHPNVLGGLIGNEVMNSLETWPAAPCVQAYARDMQRYMLGQQDRRKLPLMYAAQHDSIGAALLPAQAMKLTLDYLSCQTTESDPLLAVNVFGINVESWCSSLQTFQYNQDGFSAGSYYDLWETLYNVSIPLFYSEMGCSKKYFNRDNGLATGARDWKQIPVVLDDMGDVFSGFCAYAYDGNPDFRMMDKKGAPWNGHAPLTPGQDYNNFRFELHAYNNANHTTTYADGTTSTTTDADTALASKKVVVAKRVLCHDVLKDLEKTDTQLNLYPIDKMQTYYDKDAASTHHGDGDDVSSSFDYGGQEGTAHGHSLLVILLLVSLVGGALFVLYWRQRRDHPRNRRPAQEDEEQPLSPNNHQGNAGTSLIPMFQTQYQAIATSSSEEE